jgi:predicted nucleic acid-binding protein
MAVVLDASIVLAWLLNEEHSRFADKVIGEALASGSVAPSLFWLETTNALRNRLVRRSISQGQRDEALRDLLQLTIETDAELGAREMAAIVLLSDRHGLTTYDAAYLELAVRRSWSLATLDADLARAARAEGLTVHTP